MQSEALEVKPPAPQKRSTTAANDQVISKQRVADHGEVFTAAREVNTMLDLVRQETDSIDTNTHHLQASQFLLARG